MCLTITKEGENEKKRDVNVRFDFDFLMTDLNKFEKPQAVASHTPNHLFCRLFIFFSLMSSSVIVVVSPYYYYLIKY